jgi:hypothetical protein
MAQFAYWVALKVLEMRCTIAAVAMRLHSLSAVNA